MKIINASYDVRKMTVNKIQIENEISKQPRSSLWILKGRYKLHVCKSQGGRQVHKLLILNWQKMLLYDVAFNCLHHESFDI